MPDAAVEAAERQFVDLIRAATTNVVVRLLLFSIPEVPRADDARQDLTGRYRNISELWDTHIDGLIVTGTEPRAASLTEEPYWATLSQLVDWAQENTASTIWSCLAAHAAVLQADGVERRRLTEKRFGVFECDAVGSHPMMRGAAPQLRIPHSRHNDLPEQALVENDYRILTRSPEAGVDMFAKRESSFFLFTQGHPEYEVNTLLREYRRDAALYLKGAREHYPNMPHGLFNDEAAAMAREFRERAYAHRRPELIAGFPMAALEVGLESTWRRSAVAIYENWLDYLRGCKIEQRRRVLPFRPLRRAWRDWPVHWAPSAVNRSAS